LRQGSNPFAFSVATAGTEENCIQYDVPQLFDTQRTDLLAVVQLYRNPKQPSHVFPILGDSGTGKTHLLATFQAELQREAVEAGRESLLIAADLYSVKIDAVNFFLWQIVNHLLAQAGPGARVLRAVADRLTARLLGEGLRQLSPPQQIQLIPARSLWEKLKLGLRTRSTAQVRLDALRQLANKCDSPAPTDLPRACEDAGLAPETALSLIQRHLDRIEPKDAAGTLRKDLYGRLAQLAIRGEREPVEDFFTDDFRKVTASIAGDHQSIRLLLSILLQLLRALEVPVILDFDQLEDYLKGPTDARQQEARAGFGQAIAALLNHVQGLCLLIFAERALWNDAVLGRMDAYIRHRLDQEFTLPGRPSQREIDMPGRLSRPHLEQLIQRRVRAALGTFDPTGLPATFPFDDEHLRQLEREPTIRMCLRKLSTWFNEIVFLPSATPRPPQPKQELPQPPQVDDRLTAQLRARWDTELAGAKKQIEKEYQTRPALIPEIQTALDRWLSYLMAEGITGAVPWAGVSLITDPSKGPFGYLNVVRLNGPDAPGVGIAAWLGERKWRLTDLERRLQFFDATPCPIRTLILFRRDGEDALSGATRDLYDQAHTRGRDVRVQPYAQSDFESLLAFPRWLQAIQPDVDAGGESGKATLKAFVTRLSESLLRWVDTWQKEDRRA
jgi:hypothetical protein